jgi:hypothetical protein
MKLESEMKAMVNENRKLAKNISLLVAQLAEKGKKVCIP